MKVIYPLFRMRLKFASVSSNRFRMQILGSQTVVHPDFGKASVERSKSVSLDAEQIQLV